MSSWIDKTVCISGGFDPIQVGHTRYIQEAAKLGDLTIILNTDEFLLKKKGYIFMPWQERKEILESIKGVKTVVLSIDTDMTVCKTLEFLCPSIFAKGGGYDIKQIPERMTCTREGIKMVFGIGGDDKPQSSSWLVDGVVDQILNNEDLRIKYKI